MPVIEQIFPSLTWRIRHLAMYPDKPFDYVKLPEDFDGLHFGLYHNHHLTAVVSLFQNGNEYQFRKLAVLPEHQHKGFGMDLINYIIDFCKIQKATKLWCNATLSTKEFYTKFGFEEIGETFSKYHIDFVVMETRFAILD